MQYKNLDEWIFLKACDEAMKACGTHSARVSFVKSKLERVSSSRLAKLRSDAGNSTVSMLDKHRATHYATILPFDVLEDEVGVAVDFLNGLNGEEREFILNNFRGGEAGL